MKIIQRKWGERDNPGEKTRSQKAELARLKIAISYPKVFSR